MHAKPNINRVILIKIVVIRGIHSSLQDAARSQKSSELEDNRPFQ